MEQQELKLDFKVPGVYVDGQAIGIHDNGIVDIMFWQRDLPKDKAVKANVVAAVRYTNLNDAKEFGKLLDDTIEKWENREP